MARGQHHRSGEDLIALCRTHAVYATVGDQEVVHACAESHFAARRFNGLAHSGDDLGELVGADVRMGVHEDVRRGTERGEGLQHRRHIAALVAAGIELTVAVGARAAFTEAVIAVGVHHVIAVDGGEVAAPCADVLAALQNDGP